MTLRCTIEIVPHGKESQKYDICRIDISNTGLIKNLGFGHEICSYNVKLYRHNNDFQQDAFKWPEWELVQEGDIPEHDRRDGCVSLVMKASELMENAL